MPDLIERWHQACRDVAADLGETLDDFLKRLRNVHSPQRAWEDHNYGARRADLDASLRRVRAQAPNADLQHAWWALWAAKNLALLEAGRREWMRIKREIFEERDLSRKQVLEWLPRLRRAYAQALDAATIFGARMPVQPWRFDDLGHDVLDLIDTLTQQLRRDRFLTHRTRARLRKERPGTERRPWLGDLRRHLGIAGIPQAEQTVLIVACGLQPYSSPSKRSRRTALAYVTTGTVVDSNPGNMSLTIALGPRQSAERRYQVGDEDGRPESERAALKTTLERLKPGDRVRVTFLPGVAVAIRIERVT